MSNCCAGEGATDKGIAEEGTIDDEGLTADATMMGEVAPGKIAAKEVDAKKLMRRYCLSVNLVWKLF